MIPKLTGRSLSTARDSTDFIGAKTEIKNNSKSGISLYSR